MFDIVPLELPHLNYTWDHRRADVDDQGGWFVDLFPELEGWCATIDGEPIAVWGVLEGPERVHIWGWQTPRAFEVWKKLTRVGLAYVECVAKEYGKPVITETDNPEAARWYSYLGFVQRDAPGKYVWVGGDRRK